MFEFMHANRIKKEDLIEYVDKYKNDYFIYITYKPDGSLEIFIGSKKR